MKKLSKDEVILMLGDEYLLRDYVTIVWKKAVKFDDTASQVFLLIWNQRVVTFEVIYFKHRDTVHCSWSCEGYIYYIIAGCLTQFAKKLEGAVKND